MIHRALKLTREFHRIKQTELAEKLNISKSYLSEIESGNKSVSVALLEKYSEIFGIPVSTFFLFKESVLSPATKAETDRADRLLQFFEWVAQEDDNEEHDQETKEKKTGTS